jgi:hypothetical protein
MNGWSGPEDFSGDPEAYILPHYLTVNNMASLKSEGDGSVQDRRRRMVGEAI